MKSTTSTVPGRADPAEVVAAEVDEHHVLGALLRVGEQLGGQRGVLLGRRAARHRAGRRVHDRPRAGHGHQRLRRAADDVVRRLVAGEAQQVHVRRRVGRPQHPVDVERVDVGRHLEPLPQHHLEGVAGADVLLHRLDGVHVVAARRSAHLGHGRSRRGPRRTTRGLRQVGGHGVEARDGVVVGPAGEDVGDEQHGAVGVVEDREVGRQHHRELGHAEVVGRGAGQPLEPADDVVAEVADQAAGQRRQPGSTRASAAARRPRAAPRAGPVEVRRRRPATATCRRAR